MTAARITITKMVYTMPMALTPRRLRRTLSGEDLRAADEREELRRRVPVADRDARVDRRGHDRVQPALRRLLLEAREVEDADAGVRGVDGRIRSDGGERLRRRKRLLQEDHVGAVPRRLRPEALRRVPDDRVELPLAPDDNGRDVVERIREHRLDPLGERSGAPRRRGEQDVAALDIRRDVFEAALLEARLQRRHLDEVLAADVDPSEQRDIRGHARGIPGAWGDSSTRQRPRSTAS